MIERMRTPNHTQSAVDAVRQKTSAYQSAAADPTASAWVSANAGTGKTHVLTMRVLRLLYAGTPPERILCLTYTKAAAAEMSKRVFDRLAEWVTAADEPLSKSLSDLTGATPAPDDLSRARTLFTKAIETPGGLKVQTIHAFSERLLQRFPLEAGVPPGFKILDDGKTRELILEAIDATLTDATSSPASVLGKALTTAVRFASDANFDELLSKAIFERQWFETASRLDLVSGTRDFTVASAILAQALNVDPKLTVASLQSHRARVLNDSDLRALSAHLASGGKRDAANADTVKRAIGKADDTVRADALRDYFLTSTGEARAALMTKALGEQRPDLLSLATTAQRAFSNYSRQLDAVTLRDATLALYALAGAVLQRYTDAKAASGALDFDDLIARTTNLLSTTQQADWVLYKLDGGLDHILVDEAQDTSPEQWDIVSALAREFFAGSSARETARTMFAVGDEKQSIYSFQGAEPEKFAAMGRHFSSLAQSAGATWRPLPLNLSFRSVQAVLDAVDETFANAGRTPGLTADAGAIEHIASRFGDHGLVEIWPTETAADSEAADPWSPLADSAERAPANRLAERIAATIAGWLARKDLLVSEGRPIRPGDILVLVRKRHPFALPMVAALKAAGIPVAGSDRMKLTAQTAVQDLMALGDFLTLPEDDLALATVLKSPLFGLDDDDLTVIAVGRKGALWKSFLAHASTTARFKPAAETLKRWRAKADLTPPFEFFSSLLDRDGGRDAMLHRLGPEASDAIDEFLDLALTYDDGAPPSLTGFLADLRASDREVKRDMEHGRDEVRVMTVHGAKGLEAPIVFLPDTCTTASGDGGGLSLLTLPDIARPVGVADPIIWPVKGTSRVQAVVDAKAIKAARDAEERHRLLYVAMTRARDRLYIAGFEGGKGRSAGCWYDLIEGALSPHLDTITLDDGRTVRRRETAQTTAREVAPSPFAALLEPLALPEFARHRAPAEPQLTVPLAPSRLEPYAPDAEGEPVAAPLPPGRTHDRPSPAILAGGNRFLRGTITHALLEHLPAMPNEARAAAAHRFVSKRGEALSARVRDSIVAETLAVLNDPAFAAVFSPTSRAEVAISATIPRPAGKGPALKLSGAIDRLAISGDEVLIVDYKTNRPPPSALERVAPAYLYQLAAYSLALGEIYPGRRVKAALLWTDGPRLMDIPEYLIREYVTRLWDLDVASLDA
ncbi:MAG: double-strand break repair helicase AddA [Hyphomicrobium sp.]